jgi:serine/threonine-protein kinase/endoribonuclease IRE1
LALNLLEKMLGSETSLRPTSAAILKYPIFWTREKILTFLQDVSDRVDQEDTDSAILAGLERNRLEVSNGFGSQDYFVEHSL